MEILGPSEKKKSEEYVNVENMILTLRPQWLINNVVLI